MTTQLRSRSLWWLRNTNQTSTESSMKLWTIENRFRITITFSFIFIRIKSVETLSHLRLQWLTVVWCLTWIYASLLKRTDRRTLCMWNNSTSTLKTYMTQILKSWLCNFSVNQTWQHTQTIILMRCTAANLTYMKKLNLLSDFLRNHSSMMSTQKQHSRFCKNWLIRLFRNWRWKQWRWFWRSVWKHVIINRTSLCEKCWKSSLATLFSHDINICVSTDFQSVSLKSWWSDSSLHTAFFWFTILSSISLWMWWRQKWSWSIMHEWSTSSNRQYWMLWSCKCIEFSLFILLDEWSWCLSNSMNNTLSTAIRLSSIQKQSLIWSEKQSDMTRKFLQSEWQLKTDWIL